MTTKAVFFPLGSPKGRTTELNQSFNSALCSSVPAFSSKSSKSSQITKSGRVPFQFLPRKAFPVEEASTRVNNFWSPSMVSYQAINASLLSLGFSCFFGDRRGPKSSRNFLLCFNCIEIHSIFFIATSGVMEIAIIYFRLRKQTSRRGKALDK